VTVPELATCWLISVDSLVSSHVYEIVKTIYSTTATETSEETRVSVIQSTLGQLRLANIATLDAITTHFTRLIELTSADETYIHALANTLAPCILRPRVESSLTMNERYSYRLIRDLFAHKDAIFGELKRASALTHSSSGAQRPRAISTDESNRRANFEERSRAIAAQRSPRATSPAPNRGTGSHRRDRSQTRFPINTSSPTAERRNTLGTRNSLEVPGSVENSPIVDDKGVNGSVDGPAEHPAPSSTRVPLRRKQEGSLSRSNRDSAGSLKGESNRDSASSLKAEEMAPRGVQLEDKPMDD
jgi:hypothetical protein